ncbi:MAG: phage holin family protein [Burkholderiaceae bacterium]
MWSVIQRSLPLLYTWFSASLALWIVDAFFETIWFDRFETLLISSLLLSLVNVFIKPVLLLLTLPLAIFTLGLAIPLLNGLILMGVAELVTGFQIGGYWISVFAAFVMSTILFLINLATGQTQMRAQFLRQRSGGAPSSAESRSQRAHGPRGRSSGMGQARPGPSRGADRPERRSPRDPQAEDTVIDVEVREKKD